MRNNILASNFLSDPSPFRFHHHLKFSTCLQSMPPLFQVTSFPESPIFAKSTNVFPVTKVGSIKSLPCLLILFSTIVFLVFFLFQKSPSILITALSSLDSTSSHYYCRLELQLPASGCSGSNAPSQSQQVSLPENRKRQEEHTLKS